MTGEIEKLLAELERTTPVPTLDRVRALVALVLDVHAAGLAAVMNLLAMRGEAGQDIARELVRDRAVESLLLLHGLHPVPLADRAHAALDALAPALRTHGVTGVVLAARDGRLSVRIDPLPGATPRGSARQLVEQTLGEAAPDAELDVSLGFDDAATFVPVSRLGGQR